MLEDVYKRIEAYAATMMKDSAHSMDHVYRVLYLALDIAAHESGVDRDVLTAACLLHDIGRERQRRFRDIDHAEAGAEQAFEWLVDNGFQPPIAARIRHCIRAHSFRNGTVPETIEAKILYDADKLDVTGAIGMARTIAYGGMTAEPLYQLTGDGAVADYKTDTRASFFREYYIKLSRVYDSFHTIRGRELAAERRTAAEAFFGALEREAAEAHRVGRGHLSDVIESDVSRD